MALKYIGNIQSYCMKKIIVAFDGLKYEEATTEYAIHITKQIHAHLIGVFLDDIIYHSYRFAEVVVDGKVSNAKVKELDEKDRSVRNSAIERFTNSCQHAGLEFSVHHDRNVALRDLLHESIYADMLIIGKKENFTIFQDKYPSEFLQDLLTDVQCPVMVVPQKFKPLRSLVFLYDGAPSSVYAIKMFCNNLSSLSHLHATILSVKAEKESLHVPDGHLMKEFIKRHLPNAEFTVLKGEPENTISTYLHQQHEETLVVLGAYQRGRISRWFKPSMADDLIKHTGLPLFIAHNR